MGHGRGDALIMDASKMALTKPATTPAKDMTMAPTTPTTKPTTFPPSRGEITRLMRASLYAMNTVPNTRLDTDVATDTYHLASILTRYLQIMDEVETGALDGTYLPFGLEVKITGLKSEVEGDALESYLTFANDISEVEQWDVDLLITLESGQIETLIERSFAVKAHADEVAEKMLRLFPQASFSQMPE